MRVRVSYRAVVVLLICAACRRGDADDAGADSAAGDSGMAAMPGSPPSDEIALTAEQVRQGGIQWSPVALGLAAEVAVLPGQLVPNEDQTARLGAPAEGRVLTVHVSPGAAVARGQLLVTLQSPMASAAQSEVAKARAEVASQRAQAVYATAARDRAQRLLTLKAMPRQDYEKAVADHELAQAALAQAEAELARAQSTAEQLGVATDAGAVSGRISIRAPLAGVVLTRSAVPGSVVEAGAPLVVVTNPGTLWLTVSAPEKLASFFRRGQPLRFFTTAWPTDTFTARIDAVGAGLDATTRTLSVRAVTGSQSGRLKPEMLATVLVQGAQSVRAVLVPDDAVQTLRGKTVVFIAMPDGSGGAHYMAREVVIGSRSSGRAAVLQGLSPGDTVVTKGAISIKAQLQKDPAAKMVM